MYAGAGFAIPAHQHRQKQKHLARLPVNTHTQNKSLVATVLKLSEPLGHVLSAIMVTAMTGSAHTLN